MTIVSDLKGLALNIRKSFDMLMIFILTSAKILRLFILTSAKILRLFILTILPLFILTSAKILRFLLSTLLNTTSLKIKLNLKLKRLRRWLKPPEPISARLPDELMTIIESKLDIVTRGRYALAFYREDMLPQIDSLCTSIPAEGFCRESILWYARGRLLKTILLKSPRLLRCCTENFTGFITKVLAAIAAGFFFFVENTPELTEDSAWLLERLTGLKSLEVELPSLPCSDRFERPNLWFKWEAKFGVHGTVDHIVFIVGDTIDNIEEDENERAKKQRERGQKIAARQLLFHLSILLYLEKQGESLETCFTMRTKDVGRNEGLEIVPRSWLSLWDGRLLGKCFHVPSTTILNHSTDDAPQDVLLMFYANARREDGEFTKDDALRLCLGNFDEDDGEANQTTELQRFIKQILTDGNRRTMSDDWFLG